LVYTREEKKERQRNDIPSFFSIFGQERINKLSNFSVEKEKWMLKLCCM